MTIGMTVAVVVEIAAFITALTSIYKTIKKLTETIKQISDGTKCQLRSQMLDTYYKHKDEPNPTLKQFEFENFEKLYLAYKKLGGNSFIDKCWTEIRDGWEVIQ